MLDICDEGQNIEIQLCKKKKKEQKKNKKTPKEQFGFSCIGMFAVTSQL